MDRSRVHSRFDLSTMKGKVPPKGKHPSCRTTEILKIRFDLANEPSILRENERDDSIFGVPCRLMDWPKIVRPASEGPAPFHADDIGIRSC